MQHGEARVVQALDRIVRVSGVVGAVAVQRGRCRPACTGVLIVYGGVTVRDALTTGAISAGVFGLLPAIWVTSWF